MLRGARQIERLHLSRIRNVGETAQQSADRRTIRMMTQTAEIAIRNTLHNRHKKQTREKRVEE